MLQREFYCVGCGHPVKMAREKICLKTTRNGRFRMKAKCTKCNAKLSKFITEEHYRAWLDRGSYKACRTRRKKSKSRRSRKSKSKKGSGSRSRARA